MAEERRLLVARNSCDWDLDTKPVRLGDAHDPGAWHHGREHAGRNAEERQQVAVPGAGPQRGEQGTGGVGRIGDVYATGEPGHEPTVHGAHRK